MTSPRHLASLAGVFVVMSIGSSAIAGPPDGPYSYPKAPRSETVDDYHGTRVADPYRPLEDPDSAETRAWVEAENKITYGFLEKIPARAAIKKRLTQLWDYEKFGVPSKEGEYYYYSKNTGLQSQSVIYASKSLGAEPIVALDPNTLSSDGTVALSGTSPSDDGKLLAYGVAASGSDWQEWKVRDVEAGKDRDDLLKWIKFSSAAWTKDGKGFFYSRFPEPTPGQDLKGANYDQKLYYHELGTPQSKDTLVYDRPDHKEWQFQATVTDDGAYVINTISKGTDNKYMILYRPIGGEVPFKELIDNFEHEFEFIDNDGPIFYFKTDLNAPRGRVIAIDTRNPDAKKPKEIIPQAAETLEAVDLVGGHFLARYLKDARTQAKVFTTAGAFVREIEFPGIGTASGFDGKKSDQETFYSFTSYNRPSTIYRYEVASGKSTLVRQPKLAFNPDDYETKQVFYASKDGTKIPMFLSYKKGTSLDSGKAPTYLYGYGGFNIPLTPTFSPSNLAWMELGGVFAVANLRGGGEYGEEWHQAGTKLKKQNVFDDFIAAAEYLIKQKVTSTPHLGIAGRLQRRSARGRLPEVQRPDLFGACPCRRSACMDMLRFHEVHDRLGLDRRLWLVRRRGGIQGFVQIFPPPQRQARHLLPADDDLHRRSRRPRRPRPQLQVRRHLAGRAVVRQPRVDPHRDQGRPRCGEADVEADRRGHG